MYLLVIAELTHSAKSIFIFARTYSRIFEQPNYLQKFNREALPLQFKNGQVIQISNSMLLICLN